MPHKINFTVEQARKVLATVSPGTYYYQEAQRCLREAGSQPRVVKGAEQ